MDGKETKEKNTRKNNTDSKQEDFKANTNDNYKKVTEYCLPDKPVYNRSEAVNISPEWMKAYQN